MDSSHGEEGKVSPPAVCRPEAVLLCHQPRSHRALDGMQRAHRKPIAFGLLTHNRTVGLNVIRQMVELENCGRLGQGFCVVVLLYIYFLRALSYKHGLPVPKTQGLCLRCSLPSTLVHEA